MKLVYALEPILTDIPSVFLAGPTPRSRWVNSWRPEMQQAMLAAAYSRLASPEYPEAINPRDLSLFIPEPRGGEWHKDYLAQVEWEHEAISACTVLLFWIPRFVSEGLPGFTTNVEFGYWLEKKENLILGTPPEAEKVRYLKWLLKKHNGPNKKISSSMRDAAWLAGEMIQAR